MEGQQYVQLPPGTTECNHSHYAGNSFSASHSVQQLQNCTITNSVQSLSYTQEANGVISSGFVSSPPLPCSTISSHVPACPTRNVTVDVMPLAEAITQLSFLEFLQHCGVSIAPPQPSPSHSWMQLCRRLHLVTPFRMCPRRLLINRSPRYLSMWQCRRLPTVSTSHLWMLPYRRPHKVLRLSTSLHRWVLAQFPRFLLIFLFRLPYAVWCYTMFPHNYRSRSSLLAVLSRTILCLFVSLRHQCRVHMFYFSHRLDSNSSPRLLVSLLGLTCTLHMAHLLQLHLHELGYVQLLQLRLHSSLLVPPMWDHSIYVQPLQAREVPVLPWWERTILLIQMLVQGLFLFLHRMLSFFLWSTLVNPNLKGTLVLILLTAISCIINSAFPFYNGTQARRVKILLILFPQPVGSSMRLFYRKPVIMFRTSLISLWRSPATRTSLSCSTRILLSLTLKLTHSRPTLRAKVPGV